MAAIELLERAEREATAQRGSESLKEVSAEDTTERHGSLLNSESFGRGEIEAELAAVTRALQDEQRREVFGHFQSLESAQSKPASLVCLGESNSPAAEAFNLLGVRLINLRRVSEFRSLLITSAGPREGKSLVAANLACTLGSGARRKVLLVEGDVRRPTQSAIFGLTPVPGLCDYLMGKRGLDASLYHLPQAGIWILPAGDYQGDAGKLLQSSKLPELMKTLNMWFDWILIDSPPVLPLVDTSIWARLAQRILMVARPGTTKKRELQKGLEALDMNKVIHAVLNCSNSGADTYDYYYGHTPHSQRSQDAT